MTVKTGSMRMAVHLRLILTTTALFLLIFGTGLLHAGIVSVDFNDGSVTPLAAGVGPGNGTNPDIAYRVLPEDGKVRFLAPERAEGPAYSGRLDPPAQMLPLEGDFTLQWTFTNSPDLFRLGNDDPDATVIAGCFIGGAPGHWRENGLWFGYLWDKENGPRSGILHGPGNATSEYIWAGWKVSYRVVKSGTDFTLSAKYDNGQWHEVGTGSITLNEGGSSDTAVMTMRVYDDSGGSIDVSMDDFLLDGDFVEAPILYPLSFGGPGRETPQGMEVTPDDGYIVSTSFQFEMDCDPGAGNSTLYSRGWSDIGVTRFDAYGNLKQAFSFGGSETKDYVHDLALDAEGNIYLVGRFGRETETWLEADFQPGPEDALVSTKGGFDGFLAKYNPQGVVQWVVTMGNVLEGTNETALDVAYDQGTIYVVGLFTGLTDVDTNGVGLSLRSGLGVHDLFLAAYDTDGICRWARGLGTGLTDLEADGEAAVTTDRNGGCFVGGNFRGDMTFPPPDGEEEPVVLETVDESDIFLARYNRFGDLLWVGGIGGAHTDTLASGGMAVGEAGALYITGRFRSTADFDPRKGVTHMLATLGVLDDSFLASYSEDGELRFAFSMPGFEGRDSGRRITVDSWGNVYLGGWFKGTVDFDSNPLNNTETQASARDGASDVFLAKYDKNGNYQWVKHYGAAMSGSEFENDAGGLTADSNDNICFAGKFYGTEVDFDPAEGYGHLSSNGASDVFLAKYNSEGGSWGGKEGVYAGVWYTPEEPGSGFCMDARGNLLYLTWYVYDTDGNPVWYSSWAEHLSSEVYQGDLRKFKGWALGTEWQLPESAVIGTVTVTFDGAYEAELRWEIGEIQGGLHIEKYLQTISPGPKDPRGVTGWWEDKNYAGMGFFLEAQGDTLYMFWFHFDENGNPKWWNMGGPADVGGFPLNETFYSGDLWAFFNGRTIGGPYQEPTAVPVGSAAGLTFTQGAGGLTIVLDWQGQIYTLEPYSIIFHNF